MHGFVGVVDVRQELHVYSWPGEMAVEAKGKARLFLSAVCIYEGVPLKFAPAADEEGVAR